MAKLDSAQPAAPASAERFRLTVDLGEDALRQLDSCLDILQQSEHRRRLTRSEGVRRAIDALWLMLSAPPKPEPKRKRKVAP